MSCLVGEWKEPGQPRFCPCGQDAHDQQPCSKRVTDQYRNHAVGCTEEYEHIGSCVIEFMGMENEQALINAYRARIMGQCGVYCDMSFKVRCTLGKDHTGENHEDHESDAPEVILWGKAPVSEGVQWTNWKSDVMNTISEMRRMDFVDEEIYEELAAGLPTIAPLLERQQEFLADQLGLI